MKHENDFGASYEDLDDAQVLFDSDTGQIFNEDSPKPKEKEKEENQKPGQSKEDLIEVNLEADSKEKNASPDEDTEAKQDNSSSSLPSFKVLAKALHEQGVLSELDLDEESDLEDSEQLISLIKKEIDRNVSSWKEALPKKLKDLINNYEENVPLDRLIEIESKKDIFNSIKEEDIKSDEQLQKDIIAENFRRMGLSDDRIRKRIQQFDDLDQLEEEALDALKESKEFYAKEIEAEKAKQKEYERKAEEDREKSLAKLKEDIFKTSEIIEGITLNEKEKEKIYDSMTKVVDTDENGRPLNYVMKLRSKNPIGFEKLLHYYTSIGMFNMDSKGNLKPDISKIKTGAKSSAMDELTSALRESQKHSSGTPAREHQMDRGRIKDNIKTMKNLPMFK